MDRIFHLKPFLPGTQFMYVVPFGLGAHARRKKHAVKRLTLHRICMIYMPHRPYHLPAAVKRSSINGVAFNPQAAGDIWFGRSKRMHSMSVNQATDALLENLAL